MNQVEWSTLEWSFAEESKDEHNTSVPCLPGLHKNEQAQRVWEDYGAWWHFDGTLMTFYFISLARQWPIGEGPEIKICLSLKWDAVFPPMLEGPGVFRVPGPLDSPLSTCCSSHLALATWGGWYQGDHPHQRDPCVPTPQMGSVRQPPGGSRTGLGQDGHRCSPKSREAHCCYSWSLEM